MGDRSRFGALNAPALVIRRDRIECDAVQELQLALDACFCPATAMMTAIPRLADLSVIDDQGCLPGLKRYCPVEGKQLVVTGL